MPLPLLWPFQSASKHQQAAAIIRQHSANQADVRHQALQDLDLDRTQSILDLGCGFGYMTEALAQHVPPNAHLVGVDVWPANEEPFHQRLSANSRQGRFLCMEVHDVLPWADHTFDLVICCYSLYFFIDALPEIARVLKPQGTFVAITHSEHSVLGLLQAVGLERRGSRLLHLTRIFSAENGCAVLGQFFGQVQHVEYTNHLRFGPQHGDDLLTYLHFKLPVLVPRSRHGDELPEALTRFAQTKLARDGEVRIDKNDAIFRCRSPR